MRYILFGIENHLSQSNYDFEENPATIEHILPENGSENYIDNFPRAVYDSVVYRLGNYTLLEEDKNRQCEVLPFEEKKKIYKTSQYKLSQQIQQNDWTPNTIERRQETMANYASLCMENIAIRSLNPCTWLLELSPTKALSNRVLIE